MRFDPGRIVVPDVLRGVEIDARHDGGLWWAPCPRHQEKTPSWKINDMPGAELNGLHHCFGCGYSGTAVSLVSDVLGIQMPSAYEWVTERAMGVPTMASRVVIEVQSIRSASPFRMPGGVVLGLPLRSWVGPAREYVAGRGVTGEQVERWGLGYSVEGRLNGRVVFPVRDAHGRAVGYSARTFVGAPKRYLTAPRDENPDMGAVFGEHLWAPAANRFAVVVVEGSVNALAVDRALEGVEGVEVGALNGSNVHLRQILKVATFRRALVMTDPDLAGDRAAGLIAAALGAHVEVGRARLPTGEDADSLAQKGGTEELRRWIVRGLRGPS